MARPTEQTVESIVRAAIEGVVQRAAASIQEVIAAELASERKSLKPGRKTGRPGARSGGRRPVRQEITKWVADRNARRVPNFVIDMTAGLDTKKKIVAKYGENAAFEKGKPLPTTLKAGAGQGAASVAQPPKAARKVKAKAPVVRKKASASAT